MTSKSFVFVALLLSFALFSVRAFATYSPHQGDYFSYYEVQNLGSGTGDYSGYNEQTIINGTENVNGVAANGTVSAYYSYTSSFGNSTGSTETGSSSGDFTFSSDNFLYIDGTDDQTGYVNPTVWFCMDSSIPEGGTFQLLNTAMTVMSKNYSYYLPSQNRNVYAIFVQGNSGYQRDDVYGQFTAAYTWNTYFDPSSGYIIGYDYTEYDTSPSGTGFTYTENLYIESASYALTTVPATNPNGALSVSVSPSSVIWDIGKSLTFISTVSGGISPFSYQWYLDGSAMSGATGYSWTYANSSAGSHTVYLNVVDNVGVEATSNTGNVTVNGNSDLMKDVVLVAAIVIIIAIILAILYVVSRRRKLPKHPSQQPVYTPPSEPPPPPPPPQDINLTPKQPPVQQIVIKEVVKVKCRYCGALIDSTAEKCPFCGAPRT